MILIFLLNNLQKLKVHYNVFHQLRKGIFRFQRRQKLMSINGKKKMEKQFPLILKYDLLTLSSFFKHR